MHELGLVIEVIKRVERVAAEQKLTHIEKLVLQVGELSSVMPGYLRKCFPAAVDGTILEHTELIIEMLPGNARCNDCGKVYRYLEHPRGCKFCGGTEKEILCGREFFIKEIVAC